MILLPGTSPAGLRLPLASISLDRRARPPGATGAGAAPAAAAAPLPPGAAPRPARASVRRPRSRPTTALCVEERDGPLFVFLPPLEDLEPALELLAVVEAGARPTGVPVVLEGYPLPGDPRRAHA